MRNNFSLVKMRSVAKAVQSVNKQDFLKKAINDFFSIVNGKMRERATGETINDIFDISPRYIDRRINVRNRTGMTRRFEKAWNFDNGVIPRSVIEGRFPFSDTLISKVFHFFSAPDVGIQMYDMFFRFDNPRLTRITSFDEYANVSDREFGLVMRSILLDIMPFVYRSFEGQIRDGLDFLDEDYEISFSKFFADGNSLITNNIEEVLRDYGKKSMEAEEMEKIMPYVFNPYVEFIILAGYYPHTIPIHFRTRDTINPRKNLQNTFGGVVYPYSGIFASHYQEILGKDGVIKLENAKMDSSLLGDTEMKFIPNNAMSYKLGEEYPSCRFSDILPDGYIPPLITLGNIFNSLLVNITKKSTQETMYIHFDEKGENPVFLDTTKSCRFLHRYMECITLDKSENEIRRSLESEAENAEEELSDEFDRFFDSKRNVAWEIEKQINRNLLLALRDNLKSDKMLRAFAKYFNFPAALFRIELCRFNNWRLSHGKIILGYTTSDLSCLGFTGKSWDNDGSPVYRLSMQYTRKKTLRDLVKTPYNFVYRDMNDFSMREFQFQKIISLLTKNAKKYRADFEKVLNYLESFVDYLQTINKNEREWYILDSRYHRDLVEYMLNYFLSTYGVRIIEDAWDQFQDDLMFRKSDAKIDGRLIEAATKKKRADRKLRKFIDSVFKFPMHGVGREIQGICTQVKMMRNIDVPFNLIELKRDTELM